MSKVGSSPAKDEWRWPQERLELAGRSGNVGLWDWDLRTNQVYFSPEWKRQIGYADHEIEDSYEEWERRLHPEDREAVLSTLKSYIDNPGPEYSVEFRLRHEDGSYRWILTYASVICDANGEAERMLGSHIDITERKEAEFQLHLAAASGEAASYGMFWFRPDGRFFRVNKTSCSMTGYSEKELLAMSVQELTERYSPETWASRWRALREKKHLAYESRQRRKDGHLVPTAIDVSYVEHEGEEFGGGFARDITERKKAEKALRKSEEQLRLITDAVPGCIAYVDSQQRYQFNNKTYEAWFGLRTREIKGRHVSEVLDAAAYESTREHIEAALSGQEADFEISLPGEEQRLASVYFVPCRNDRGECDGFYVLATDITDRKRAEQALQRSADELQRVMASISDYLWSGEIDNSGRFHYLYYSPVVEQITGRPPEFYLSGPERWLSTVHPEDRPRLKNALARLLEGESQHEEYRIRRPDGSIRWLRDRVDARRLHDGVLRFDGVVSDISSEKGVEEEKENLEAQLRQAQKLEALGVLAGGVAHEFNNMHFAISMNVELAQDYVTQGSEVDKHLEAVLKGVERAKQVVQQVLSCSRGERSQPRRLVPAVRVVEEALDLLRASVPTTLEIRRNIDAECGALWADVTQLHQVVMNLCTNAYQSMQLNKGILDVNLQRTEVDTECAARHPNLEVGPHVRLEIRDDGVGIAPEVQERVFDPFFTTKEVGQGTGLGLAVVHGIVKDHDGAITLESRPDGGTKFVVYFPLASSESREREGAKADSETPEGDRSEHILFVDDEAIIARAAEMMLLKLGYKVTARTESEEAFDLFREQAESFDLVITDRTMPKLTGFNLTRKIKELRPDLPVILVTGHGKIVPNETAQDMGIAALLSKPLRPAEIGKAIRQVLNQQGAPAS